MKASIHVIIDSEVEKEKVCAHLKNNGIPVVETAADADILVVDFDINEESKTPDKGYVKHEGDVYVTYVKVINTYKNMKTKNLFTV